MSGDSELDVQRLIGVWQAPSAASTAADDIRDYVRRRSRLLRLWFGGELAVGTAFLAFLTHRAVTHSDPVEQLAMALLALITAAAMAFGIWNWYGALDASAADTRTFVAISTARAHRLARSIRASWVVLAAQIAVFTPWVYHRLYAGGRDPSLASEVFGWGLLTMMVILAVVFILAVQWWARRDATVLRQIRRELDEE
jgi:hypothetical protein